MAALLHSEGAARQDAARQLRAASRLAAAADESARAEWRKALAPALTHETWFARWVAVEGLALAHAELAAEATALLPLLEPRLRDPSYSVRLTVARVLAGLAHEAALPALAVALEDESPAIQEVAAQGLGQLADERTALSLLAALPREDPFVRRAVVLALMKLAARGALPANALSPLQQALTDPDDAVRLAAAKALHEMDATPQLETITDALIERLSDTGADDSTGEKVCDAAAAALARIGSSNAQAALARWRGRQYQQT